MFEEGVSAKCGRLHCVLSLNWRAVVNQIEAGRVESLACKKAVTITAHNGSLDGNGKASEFPNAPERFDVAEDRLADDNTFNEGNGKRLKPWEENLVFVQLQSIQHTNVKAECGSAKHDTVRDTSAVTREHPHGRRVDFVGVEI